MPAGSPDSEFARGLAAEVLAELRHAVGEAWIEPARVHVRTLSKLRASDGLVEEGTCVSTFALDVYLTTGVMLTIERDMGADHNRIRTRR